MRTGVEQEPVARAMYEAHTGHMVDETSFYVSDDGVFGLSPDGLIDDDGIVLSARRSPRKGRPLAISVTPVER